MASCLEMCVVLDLDKSNISSVLILSEIPKLYTPRHFWPKFLFLILF